ncbi:glycosyltransferase family 9 protein [Polaromonas sp.]|uniref:glycosyltransferase family 9 protein n=1 Tax=Polaromonas sp. TaxID=1869339 RepID=UPI0018301AC5|nr:glycosyltransferase family 9 protein [Polaromonas sp.]NMM04965.1 glycosyltransferase family 9 protein [Polaromonas sp.]
MIAYATWLKKQALISVTQPLSCGVESNEVDYTNEVGYKKLGWRHFRRTLVFALSGQHEHLSHRIERNWRKGLWLYKGIPQIGDSLMDLAPRSLLHQQGFCIDLFTDSHLASLYRGDPWFNRVHDDPRAITNQHYDFVIVPSHKGRSLKTKSLLLPNHPWVSMHGFYTGPDFHRAKFATQRIIDLLGYEASEQDFALHQDQKLAPLAGPPAARSTIKKIAFAFGGVHTSRTFQRWGQLAKALLNERTEKIEFTLLGSSNAVDAAQMFMNEFAEAFQTFNQVNKTSLAECRELIHQQDLFIAADGGLMHLGATTATRLVSLFNSEISPHWRLSGAHLRSALQSATRDVSDIPVNAIVKAARNALTDC